LFSVVFKKHVHVVSTQLVARQSWKRLLGLGE